VGERVAELIGERMGFGGTARVMAVDSMQVYRGMDIGTAKPDAATRARIPYLMLDVADPWESYSAARFVEEARGHLVNAECGMPNAESDEGAGGMVMVAGTILYLRALMEGLFEGPGANEAVRKELHERAEKMGTAALHGELEAVDTTAAGRIHRNDLRRIVRALEVYRLTGTPISVLQTQWSAAHPGMDAIYIGIRREREALNRRINSRVRGMMEAGLVEEVRRLADDPSGFSQEAASAVGYRQLLDYFAGKYSLEDAVEQIKIQTRHLAKMQRTWLKRWPAPGKVHWIDAGDGESGEAIAGRAMAVIEPMLRNELE
jgi:tRNA dimethylallyltransferase